MISIEKVKRYCSESAELIENYEKAVSDTTQTWHLHHRWETDFSYSVKELKEIGEYYGVSADKLIFLTPFEHKSIHHKGKRVSEESRRKISKKKIGKKMCEVTKMKISDTLTNGKLSKNVLQYSLNGVFIKEWVSMSEVERQLGFSKKNICKCCQGKRQTAYNYIWRYK